MELATLDWIIIIGFLVISLTIGLSFRNQASGTLVNFFLGGRNLPWYIAGISMVATTFAADTPLAVAEMVADKGIAKNWLWWSFLAGGMLTTFLFAHLWRRAEIVTELELLEIRYSGKQARFLRQFKAVYLGVFMNCLIIGWVNLAFASILTHFFGVPDNRILFVLFGFMLFAAAYSAASGLLGVAITDTIQFLIAIVGTTLLAFFVIDSPEVGGVANLRATLPSGYFNLFPSGGGGLSDSFYTISLGTFLGFILVQWWASWYPGSEPGGGGYIAQRMMSTRSENDAVKATLLFQIGHYCLRPWPWILVALAAVMLYDPHITMPDHPIVEQVESLQANEVSWEEAQINLSLTEGTLEYEAAEYLYKPRVGYLRAMEQFLPTGMKGLLLVAFIAAYLSTISTQLNMGASFLVNDLYMPNRKDTTQKEAVSASRIMTFVLMLIGLGVTSMLESISGVWAFIIEAGAGLGAVMILRWYWWRINAWSEISAMVAPFIFYGLGNFVLTDWWSEAFLENNGVYWFTVAGTTVTWIVVTFLTPPESDTVLTWFVNRVKPDGFWGVYRSGRNSDTLKWRFVAWFAGIGMAFGILFATGKFVLLEADKGFIWTGIALLSMLVLNRAMKRIY